MAKKILNLPTIEELTNNQDDTQEDVTEGIQEIQEEIPLDIEDEIEDDFVEEPITEEALQHQHEDEYDDTDIQDTPPRTEYSEDEEAEALEEIARERDSKKKTPRKLNKNIVIGAVSTVAVVCVLILGVSVFKKITGNKATTPQHAQEEEVQKQDFENYERLKLSKPNAAPKESAPEQTTSTNSKSGQAIVHDYKLEYPYVDVTLKEDADGQFILSYNKNNTKVLCYSQENQFVGGKAKRIEMSCETNEDLSNDKPLTYYFKDSD